METHEGEWNDNKNTVTGYIHLMKEENMLVNGKD